MDVKAHTTEQAAKSVGITRVTLQAWIAKGKLKAPRTQLLSGHAVRLWTKGDLAILRRAKKKIYMKEVGRPKNKKK
jgi:excisionase family DNA binding protein